MKIDVAGDKFGQLETSSKRACVQLFYRLEADFDQA